MSMKLANKLAGAINKYHNSKPQNSLAGSNESPELPSESPKENFSAKQGPSGPEHGDHVDVESPGKPLADHNDHSVHNTDMEQLQNVICPGCHDKLRSHLVAGASGSKEPNTALR